MPESPDSSLYRGASPLETSIGLFAGTSFRLATGRCLDCAAIPQGLWYFADETIAAPRAGVPVAGFTRGINVWQDVERWSVTHRPGSSMDAPPFVWIGSPEIVRGASLSADGATLTAGAKRWSFALVPKIPLNRSYYNAASTAYLAPRTLTVRGSSRHGVFTARTLWPADFRLDSSAPSQRVDATPEAVRALVRAEPRGGAQSPFAAITLWERSPGSARRWERARVASQVQGALERTYNQFYRHQLLYDHATMNCTSISVSVLRALGWNVPARGATSWAVAALGFPYFALRERRLANTLQSFDYLTEDRTRLFPAAGFEEIGADLLRLATGRPARAPTPFEAMLADDLEALVFLRIPQL